MEGFQTGTMRPAWVERSADLLVAYQLMLSMLVLLAWMVFEAFRVPADACYDLANYHLYGPFALLHGKLGYDLAPAQAQGYLPPLNDLPYYLLSRAITSVRVLNMLLVLPEAAALALVFLITIRVTEATDPITRLVVLVSVVVGATGAATHPVIATSMSDMVPCALILGGMLILVRLDERLAAAPVLPVGLAGLLIGIAIGLKLTLSYAAVGIVAGLPFWTGLPAQARLRAAVLVSAGIAIGLVGCDGWWWYRLYAFSGNPMFPIYNDVFRSPLAPFGDFVDTRFLPRNRLQTFLYPFLWATDSTPLVTEPDQPMRDPRLALALLACVGLLLLSAWRRARVPGGVRFLAVLYLVGYVLWQRQFSIFRYLSLLELLSGPMLAVLALTIVRSRRGRGAVLAATPVLLSLLILYTVPPHWGRLPQAGGRPMVVRMQILDPRSLVLLLDASPLAFLALHQPVGVRFYGTANNLTQPWIPTLMSRRIRSGIDAQLRDHPDLLWGIERPDHRFGNGDDALTAYGLHRVGCQAITASIVFEPIRLCRLARR